MNINIPKRDAPKKKRVYIHYDGKRYELVGVKAMLVPVDEIGGSKGKLIWADVKLDVLLLKAALDPRKMDKKQSNRKNMG